MTDSDVRPAENDQHWTFEYSATGVLMRSCERCGASVLSENTRIHDAWHDQLEATPATLDPVSQEQRNE